MDCSTLWTRRPEALRAAFAAEGAYLAPSEGAVDLRDYGPALGRRFRALKLWMVLRCYGREGLQRLIREQSGSLPCSSSGCGTTRTGRSWRRATSRRSASAIAGATTTRSPGAPPQPDASSSPRRASRGGRDPARDRERADERGRRAGRLGGAARLRAVIFDLWDTLVEWPAEEGAKLAETLAGLAGVSPRELEPRLRASYRRLQTEPLAVGYRELGPPNTSGPRSRPTTARPSPPPPSAGCGIGARRAAGCRDQARHDLGLFRGGAGTLAGDRPCGMLRRRDLLLALRPDEARAGDLSADRAGSRRRSPRLPVRRRRRQRRAGGSGTHAGMQPVLFLPSGTRPRWPEVSDWSGPSVSSFDEVLALC